jgi:RNA polymerase sigma-70 factor (ECF subfamily)
VVQGVLLLRRGGKTQEADAVRPAKSSPPDDDLRLLHAGQEGDHHALGELLTRHEVGLYRLCIGITGHPSDAEDAVQETFLRALRALTRPGGFRGEASFRTWLYRIAANVCLERRRVRKPSVSLEDLPEEFSSPSPGPERLALARAALREAMAALLPRQRILVTLREQEEWTVAEIASLLGWQPKKVENELYKARRVLARWKKGTGEWDG